MKNFGKYLVIAIVVLVAIVLLVRYTSCNAIEPNRPVIIPAAEILKKVDSGSVQYKLKYDSAVVIINKKDSSAKVDKIKLNELLAIKRRQAIDINTLLSELQSNDINKADNDYEAGSLKDQFSNYVANNNASDSLCNATISNLDSLIIAKNSQLFAGQQESVNIRRMLDKALDNQAALDQYSKDLKRALRKKNAANWAWKTVIAAAGAFLILKK